MTETQTLMDQYQLPDLTQRDVELFRSSNYIDAATRGKLDKLVEIKSRINAVDVRIEGLEKEAKETEDDQKRLRENIDKLKSTAEAKQLIARYVAKADAQETQLEQIEKEKRTANEERTHQQAELAAAIRAFELNRKLQP